MPKWVEDEKLFSKAVVLFIRNNGHSPKESKDWAIIAGIYKKLGGRVKKTKKEMIDALGKDLVDGFKADYIEFFGDYKNKLDEMMENNW